MMDTVLLAGFGGQGVMFLGKVLAYSGMLAGREVCWIPSYGPEMRGGTANCSVILATDEIHSPVVEMADTGIVLNQPSYDKFLPRIKPGGALVVNNSIVDLGRGRRDIDLISLPAAEMANDLGNPALANMVSLGALLSKLKMIDLAGVEKALAAIMGEKRPDMLEINLSAIQQGMKI
ncbi:2-oxoacid:acceptor oxidoreductase family protein [Acetonema longum]|uniref:Pyruvate ferredoxin/flavodoxin oxidoreductase n=1 Tax=Acetonema longum DSM 6540 TaxID=1009370 RepID=F7NQD8_9FIRM|nr:2-oxoacid:acceptor oxidoreductase family protein [Acetonema longum]EGO61716.1 pyruvate ferredoxin/flavodoxin oxidoreductase [Acetonema longum DSM 6540]